MYIVYYMTGTVLPEGHRLRGQARLCRTMSSTLLMHGLLACCWWSD